jgi:hypothetical protein
MVKASGGAGFRRGGVMSRGGGSGSGGGSSSGGGGDGVARRAHHHHLHQQRASFSFALYSSCVPLELQDDLSRVLTGCLRAALARCASTALTAAAAPAWCVRHFRPVFELASRAVK